MKRRILGSVLLIGILLMGCGSSEEGSTKTQDAQETLDVKSGEAIVEQTGEIAAESATTGWDEVIHISGYTFKMGDTVGSLMEQGFTGCEYIGVEDFYVVPCSNKYRDYSIIELDFALKGTNHVYAINPYPYACRLEDCVIGAFNIYSTSTRDELFPGVEKQSDADEFFGLDNKVEDEYSNKYVFDNTIIKTIDNGNGKESIYEIDIEWNRHSDEQYYFATIEYGCEREEIDFDTFRMGLNQYQFADTSKISNLTGKFLDDYDYAVKVSFDYKCRDGKEYYIRMSEASQEEFLDINEYCYVKEKFEIAGYECGIERGTSPDTYVCRYDGNVYLEFYVKEGATTKEDCLNLFNDLSEYLVVTPVSE